jgi:sec-independent protein translocase protein TatC
MVAAASDKQPAAPGSNGSGPSGTAPGGPKKPRPLDYDPDQYRMTLGDHLEELRGRMFLALGGYAVLLVLAFFFGDTVVSYFCLPLIRALGENDINTQLIVDEAGEGFTVFIQISMISAAAVGAPWIAYQLWQFVAVGLYPHERRYVTKFLPVSIALLVSGMLFVYFLILPWTLSFLVGFNNSFKVPSGFVDPERVPAAVATSGLPKIPILQGNPETAAPGDYWYDAKQKRLKFFVENQVRIIPVNSNNLLATEIKLSTYIELVMTSLIVFGLSFQLPLIVLTVERIGVVPLQALKDARRYVYFILSVAAAVITPGGDIPSMLGLTLPLIGLYELGIWMAKLKPKTVLPA